MERRGGHIAHLIIVETRENKWEYRKGGVSSGWMSSGMCNRYVIGGVDSVCISVGSGGGACASKCSAPPLPHLLSM